MRKAGELIAEMLRERKLSTNRANPIGQGANGVVFASDVPGNVMKQTLIPDESFPGRSLEKEVNLQAIAAEMGIAPRIAGLEKFVGGIGNRIEMEDVRRNFSPHSGDRYGSPVGRDAVRINQQLGQLALKGVDLDDRHSGNIVYNNMTGRPMQIDFGIAERVEGEQQIDALARATEAGFKAAGLGDVAQIYTDTVYDLMAGGQFAEAMDVAKQGFSRLQKIK